MRSDSGFTLLEVLVALAIFAMIAAFTYAATVPAGEGFEELKKVRDRYVQAFTLGRQMRLDVSALALSQDQRVTSLRLVHDVRSGLAYDELIMLVREPDRPTLSLVRYYLDESTEVPQLVREVVPSLPGWPDKEPLRWNMGDIESLEVQAMEKDGHLLDTWDSRERKALPSALVVRWKDVDGERELVFPIFVQLPSQTPPAGFG
jgi:prepilin-type N-terminal cleavage/methylation domain-containing protein